MTAAELIAKLQELPGNTPIVLHGGDYDDYEVGSLQHMDNRSWEKTTAYDEPDHFGFIRSREVENISHMPCVMLGP